VSRTVEGRIRRLEDRGPQPEVIVTEDGRKVSVAAGLLVDCWLHAMAPMPGELLPVETAIRDALAVARIPTGDWQLAQIRRAARGELGMEEGA
jgi:hypothetical protein